MHTNRIKELKATLGNEKGDKRRGAETTQGRVHQGSIIYHVAS